jgi:hypothetical protein
MLWAVLMAVMIMTGTAPTNPAKNKYLNNGNTWWTTKFTIVIVVLRQYGSKEKDFLHQCAPDPVPISHLPDERRPSLFNRTLNLHLLL